MRADRCCLCGALRRPTQEPVESFGNGTVNVPMAAHRPIGEGAWEQQPSLLVGVNIWRNGGTSPGETHMCDGCIVVGLKAAKLFVDSSLAGLGALSALEEAQAVRADKRAPVQGFSGGIPWEMHLRAYDVYCKRWSPQPALIDLEGRNCRGGFAVLELDDFIPGWRDELTEIARLKAEIASLKSGALTPGDKP